MKYEQMNNNRVFLTGKVETKPVFSHESFGEAFYEIMLSVNRLSDNHDNIPVIVSEKFLTNDKFDLGKTVSIKGQFRSYNKLVDEKSKLMLSVFVREIVDFDESMNPNIIELTGYICKAPTYRTTPFNREICDVLVAVNRAYNKSDYLPCIAWGRNAKYVSELSVGAKVNIVGRIQSREYQKKLENGEVLTKTAYEVSINKVSEDKDSEENRLEESI